MYKHSGKLSMLHACSLKIIHDQCNGSSKLDNESLCYAGTWFVPFSTKKKTGYQTLKELYCLIDLKKLHLSAITYFGIFNVQITFKQDNLGDNSVNYD